MNKIYKVIWSKVRHCYVVTNEFAKANAKASHAGRKATAAAVALAAIVACGGVNVQADTLYTNANNIVNTNADGTEITTITIGDITIRKGDSTSSSSIQLGDKAVISSKTDSVTAAQIIGAVNNTAAITYDKAKSTTTIGGVTMGSNMVTASQGLNVTSDTNLIEDASAGGILKLKKGNSSSTVQLTGTQLYDLETNTQKIGYDSTTGTTVDGVAMKSGSVSLGNGDSTISDGTHNFKVQDVVDLKTNTAGITHSNGATSINDALTVTGTTTLTSGFTVGSSTNGITSAGILTAANGSTVGNVKIDGSSINSTNSSNPLTVEGVALQDHAVSGVSTLGVTDTATFTKNSKTTTIDGGDVTINAGETNQVLINDSGIKVGLNSTYVNADGIATTNGSLMAGGTVGTDAKFVANSDGSVKAAGGEVGIAKEGTTTFGSNSSDQTVIAKGTITAKKGTIGNVKIDGNTIDNSTNGTLIVEGVTLQDGTLTTGAITLNGTTGALTASTGSIAGMSFDTSGISTGNKNINAGTGTVLAGTVTATNYKDSNGHSFTAEDVTKLKTNTAGITYDTASSTTAIGDVKIRDGVVSGVTSLDGVSVSGNAADGLTVGTMKVGGTSNVLSSTNFSVTNAGALTAASGSVGGVTMSSDTVTASHGLKVTNNTNLTENSTDGGVLTLKKGSSSDTVQLTGTQLYDLKTNTQKIGYNSTTGTTVDGVAMKSGSVSLANGDSTISDGTHSFKVQDVVDLQTNTAGITRTGDSTNGYTTNIEGVVTVDSKTKETTFTKDSTNKTTIGGGTGTFITSGSTTTINENGLSVDGTKAGSTEGNSLKFNVATGVTTFTSKETGTTETTTIQGNSITTGTVTAGSTVLSNGKLKLDDNTELTTAQLGNINSTITGSKTVDASGGGVTFGANGAGGNYTISGTGAATLGNSTIGKVTLADGNITLTSSDSTISGGPSSVKIGELAATNANTAGIKRVIGTPNKTIIEDNTTIDNTGKAIFGGTSTNQTTIDNGKIATTGTVTINGATLTGSTDSLTSDKQLVSAKGFAVANNTALTDGMLQLGTNSLTNDQLGVMNAAIKKDASGTIVTANTFTDGSHPFTASEVTTTRDNTAGITRTGTATSIENLLKVDQVAKTVTIDTGENGANDASNAVTINKNGIKVGTSSAYISNDGFATTTGSISTGNGSVDANGKVDEAKATFLAKEDGSVKAAAGNVNIAANGISTFKSTDTGSGTTTINGATLTGTNTAGDQVYALNKDGSARFATGKVNIAADGTTTYGTTTDNTKIANGAVTATGTIQGKTITDGTASLTGGALTGVNQIDGASVSGTSGALTISNVTMNNGDVTASTAHVGNVVISDSSIENKNTADALSVEGVSMKDGTMSVANKYAINSDGSASLANGAFSVGTDGTTTVHALKIGTTTYGISDTGAGTLKSATIGSVSISGNTIDAATPASELQIEKVTLENGTVSTGDAANKATLDKTGLTVTSTTGNTKIGSDSSIFKSTGSTTTIDNTGLTVKGNGSNYGELQFRVNDGTTIFTNTENGTATNTTIKGNVITTGVLKTNTVELGNGQNGVPAAIALNADGSASFASKRVAIDADGDFHIKEEGTNTNDTFSVTAKTGAVTMAGGKAAVDADGAVTMADGKVIVDKDGGTTFGANAGTSKQNQTVIKNGEFTSNATDVSYNSNTTTSGATEQKIELSSNGGKVSTQDATSSKISNKVAVNTAYGSTDVAYDKITNTVGNTENTSTVAQTATAFSALGNAGYGLNVSTTDGVTTVKTANGLTTLDGGSASFVNGTNKVEISDGSATFTSATAGTSSKEGKITKIDGGTITTDTLDVQKIILGENIVDPTGKDLSGKGSKLEISSDGSLYAASGAFQVSKEGYVTNTFVGANTGDTVKFSTDTAGLSSSYANNTTFTTTSNKVADGSITDELVQKDAQTQKNVVKSVTEKKTIDGITDEITAGTNKSTTTKTASNTTDEITDGTNTSTVAQTATAFSALGNTGYGLTVNTTAGVTTVKTANGVTTLDGGSASFVHDTNNKVEIKDGSATFTSATAGTSSKKGTNTTIDGGTIKTDTLTAQKIILGESLVNENGTPLATTEGGALAISSDGSLYAASGAFKVSKEGYVTNQFAGAKTNDTVNFSTGTSGVSSSYTNSANIIANTKVADGTITSSVSAPNTTTGATSTSTIMTQDSVTTTVGNGSQENKTTNTLTSNKTSVTFDGNKYGTTNEITTDGMKTTLNTADGTTVTINTTKGGTEFSNTKANTPFNGGTATSTIINGNTITTGQITTDSLVITGTSTNNTTGANTNGALVMGGDGSLSSKVESSDKSKNSTFESTVDGMTATAAKGTNSGNLNVNAGSITAIVADGTYTGGSLVTATKTSIGVEDQANGIDATTVSGVDSATKLASTVSTVKDAAGSNITTNTSTSSTQAITDGTNTNTMVSNATSTKQTIGSTTFVNDAAGSATTVDGHIAAVTGSDVTINKGENSQIKLSEMGQVSNINSNIQGSTVVDSLNNEYTQRVEADNRLNNRINKVGERLNRVGAMSAAISNLKTMGYDPAAPTEITAAIGAYKGDKAVALGVNHYVNQDIMMTLSYAQSGSENMGGLGATFRLGRTNAKDVIESQRRKTEKRIEEAQARALAAHQLYEKAVKDGDLAKKYAEAASNEEIRKAAKDEDAATQEYQNVKDKYNQELAPSFKVK
ncbi:MAG: YadA-like family protein [Megasphaera sp.]|jgi:hypothetical protein|nr:YadA-like family protein [Megasphaera sp.]